MEGSSDGSPVNSNNGGRDDPEETVITAARRPAFGTGLRPRVLNEGDCTTSVSARSHPRSPLSLLKRHPIG